MLSGEWMEDNALKQNNGNSVIVKTVNDKEKEPVVQCADEVTTKSESEAINSPEMKEEVAVETKPGKKEKPVNGKKERAEQNFTYVHDESLPENTKLIGQEYIKEEMNKPLGVFFYYILPLIMILPVVNLVFIFSWTFGKYVNVNKRRIGIAAILWLVLLIVVAVLFGDTIFLFLSDWYDTVKGA